MKYLVVWAMAGLLALPAQAQEINSLPHYWSYYEIVYSSLPGATALPSFGTFNNSDRLDMNGDGFPELITIARNENNVPQAMTVTDVTKGNELHTFFLNDMRDELIASHGFTSGQAFDHRFQGFIQVEDGAKGALFIVAGAPVIELIDGTIMSLLPGNWNTLGLLDVDGDGRMEIVLADKVNQVVTVTGSKAAS